MNFTFWKSPLKQAIERGIASGKLREELSAFDDYEVRSKKDGEAVCWGLRQLQRSGSAPLSESAYQLAGLFLKVRDSDCAALEPLRSEGMSELIRLYDESRKAEESNSESNILYLLKVMAFYGTTGGVLKIIEAAQEPFAADSYMWSVILKGFDMGHPQNGLLYGSLSDPLPDGFIAVSLLDAANKCMFDGEVMTHPFDSKQGMGRLREWISSRDESNFSYAHSACACLPYLRSVDCDELLNAAALHPDRGVRTEAAWAEAKMGRESGFQRLATLCLDLNASVLARQYLDELGRPDIIPPEAKRPDFVALSEFNNWLAHPSELGRNPDALEIVDHRELKWPPEREPKPFWLIQYTVKDQTGLEDDDVECGLVGSITFCFFSYKLSQRPPEDAYAVHCYWEMEHADLVEEADVSDDASEYQSLLSDWSGPPLKNVRLMKVAEVSPKLSLDQRLIGFASASLNDEAGFVVLDGKDSEWHPKSEQPEGASEGVVLKIHVGRKLLGFTNVADRKKYLRLSRSSRSPARIIEAYEKLVADANAKEGKDREDALSLTWSPIGKHLAAYASALSQTGQGGRISALLDLLSPFGASMGGYSTLGEAALICAQSSLAEQLLMKRWAQGADACVERGDSMSKLAELWFDAGKTGDACALLGECMKRILAGSRAATGPDLDQCEEWYQIHRTTYLKLFSDGDSSLRSKFDLPPTTLV